MELLSTKQELQAALSLARSDHARIGLVPTMGALHAGHAALISAARRASDVVVVSLFVNPTQFAAGEDLERYPRDLARDAEFARAAGADLLFAPSAEEMYGTATEPTPQTTIDVGELGHIWEGALRPTHFAGVALVVTKLLSLVRPDRAWFGEKDYQQLCVIRQLVRDLDIPTEIVGAPTVRETDGLALSSRNRYLDGEARSRATALSAALAAVQQAADAGQHDARALEAVAEKILREDPAIQLGYRALVDPDTLRPVALLERPARFLISATLSGVHLIDNAEIRPPAEGTR